MFSVDQCGKPKIRGIWWLQRGLGESGLEVGGRDGRSILLMKLIFFSRFYFFKKIILNLLNIKKNFKKSKKAFS